MMLALTLFIAAVAVIGLFAWRASRKSDVLQAPPRTCADCQAQIAAIDAEIAGMPDIPKRREFEAYRADLAAWRAANCS